MSVEATEGSLGYGHIFGSEELQLGRVEDAPSNVGWPTSIPHWLAQHRTSSNACDDSSEERARLRTKNFRPLMARCERVKAQVEYRQDGTLLISLEGTSRDINRDPDHKDENSRSRDREDHDRNYEGEPTRGRCFSL